MSADIFSQENKDAYKKYLKDKILAPSFIIRDDLLEHIVNELLDTPYPDYRKRRQETFQKLIERIKKGCYTHPEDYENYKEHFKDGYYTWLPLGFETNRNNLTVTNMVTHFCKNRSGISIYGFDKITPAKLCR